MQKTLTKIDIAKTIAAELGLTRKQALEKIENLMEIVKLSLESGEDVLISGFGKFCVNHKNARRGRNPATDGELMLAARKVVGFKCSGKLRDMLNPRK